MIFNPQIQLNNLNSTNHKPKAAHGSSTRKQLLPFFFNLTSSLPSPAKASHRQFMTKTLAQTHADGKGEIRPSIQYFDVVDDDRFLGNVWPPLIGLKDTICRSRLFDSLAAIADALFSYSP